MSNKKVFSANLRRYMALNDMSRKELANKLGISYYTVTDWVNGKKYPRMDKIEKISNCFGILKSQLIEKCINEDDTEFIASLGKIHNKEELPPEMEAINTLLYSYGLQFMKVKDEYYFDEAGQLTKEELNEFLNTVTTMVHSAADAFIKKKTHQNMRDFFNKQ